MPTLLAVPSKKVICTRVGEPRNDQDAWLFPTPIMNKQYLCAGQRFKANLCYEVNDCASAYRDHETASLCMHALYSTLELGLHAERWSNLEILSTSRSNGTAARQHEDRWLSA
jgi:hypothetical protein